LSGKRGGFAFQVRATLWLAVLAVWLVGLFRQGLFYPMAQLVVGAILAVLAGGALALSWRSLRAWRPGLVDLGLGLIVVAYLLSMTQAVRPDAAALQTSLCVSGFALYLAVRTGAFGPSPVVAGRLRLAVVAGALLVTLAGMLATVGLVHMTEPTLDGMLVSTFQYHNSYAVLALVGLILALSSTLLARTQVAVAGGAVASAWLLLGVFLSQSRGVWLVAPVALGVWLIGIPGVSRGRAFLLLVAAFVGAAAATPWALRGLEQGTRLHVLGSLVLAAVLAGALGGLVDGMWRRRATLGRAVARTLAAAAALSLALGAALFRSRLGRVVPHVLAARAGSLSLSDASVETRILIFRIAFALIRRVPFTGYGGGAWLDLYHNVSPVFFTANETHSFVTQVVLEAGPLAAIGLLLTVVAVALSALRGRRLGAGTGAPTEIWGLAAALLALVGHAAFDFDMSYLTLAALAWLIVGLCCAEPQKTVRAEILGTPRVPTLRRYVAWPALSVAVAALALVGCGSLALARGRLGAAEVALREGHVTAARVDAVGTLALDPWSTAAYETEAATTRSERQRVVLLRHGASLTPDAPDAWSAYGTALLADHRVGSAVTAGAHALAVGAWDVLAVTATARVDDAAMLAGGGLARQGRFAFAELQAEVANEGNSLVVPLGSGVGATTAQARLNAAMGEGDVLVGAPASAVQALEAAASADPAMRPLLGRWLRMAARRLGSAALEDEAATWIRS
jgi:hypothetical protein